MLSMYTPPPIIAQIKQEYYSKPKPPKSSNPQPSKWDQRILNIISKTEELIQKSKLKENNNTSSLEKTIEKKRRPKITSQPQPPPPSTNSSIPPSSQIPSLISCPLSSSIPPSSSIQSSSLPPIPTSSLPTPPSIISNSSPSLSVATPPTISVASPSSPSLSVGLPPPPSSSIPPPSPSLPSSIIILPPPSSIPPSPSSSSVPPSSSSIIPSSSLPLPSLKKTSSISRGCASDSENLHYQGEISNSKKNGFGTLTNTLTSQTIYSGNWKNNYYHGKGKLFNINYSTSSSWELDYKNLDSVGEHWISYEGDFINGCRNGVGIVEIEGGWRYEGGFKQGYFHGKGVVERKEEKVEGEWRLNIFVSNIY